MTDVLYSEIDSSVNFIEPINDGFFESRYVHRPDTDYFIAYLSSHNGCNKACRFCHLTATGQTTMQPATEEDLYQQFEQVYHHYLRQPERLDKVHINFMARGEPLANPNILDPKSWFRFSSKLVDAAWMQFNLQPSFRISTIMPEETLEVNLEDTFFHEDEVLYYSLYSFDPRFRKRWLPKAIDPVVALEKLARWQGETGQELKIHFALISGENDSRDQIEEMIRRVKASGVSPSFNIVRFNSPNEDKYRESSDIEQINQMLQTESFESRVIPRVGKDVFASCGMFTQ